MQAEDIRYLCFGGGGIRGIAFAGAISEMVRLLRFDLSRVLGACGSSIGALYAAAVVCGKSADFIENMARTTSLMDFVTPDMTKLFLEWGLDNTQQLERWVDTHLGDRQQTFKQLFDETGKVLKVTATNLHLCSCYMIDHESEPDMPIAHGVAMSMCLPPMFAPVQHRGQLHVDGGLFNNYPISEFPAGQTLGFKCLWKHVTDLHGFEKYFGRLTYCVLASSERALWQTLDDEYKRRTIDIDCGDVSTINFRLTPHEAGAMVERGKARFRDFVREHDVHALWSGLHIMLQLRLHEGAAPQNCAGRGGTSNNALCGRIW